MATSANEQQGCNVNNIVTSKCLRMSVTLDVLGICMFNFIIDPHTCFSFLVIFARICNLQTIKIDIEFEFTHLLTEISNYTLAGL